MKVKTKSLRCNDGGRFKRLSSAADRVMIIRDFKTMFSIKVFSHTINASAVF